MEAVFHAHSFIEIQTKKGSILIDPFIDGNTFCDVNLEQVLKKDIIAIIITHGHSDHIGSTIEIAKELNTLVISSFEVIEYLKNTFNLTKVHSMSIGGEYEFDFGKVKFVNAVHGCGVGPNLLAGIAAGVLLTTEGKKIYHAGDTALIYDMKLLEDEKIDLAFLPIGGNFTMGIDDAVKATEFIKPRLVSPIHYNTFDVIKADPSEFAQKVMLGNLAVCKVLRPGQSVVVDM